VLSRFFSLLLPLPTAAYSTIMVKLKATAEELEARAESNGYKRGTYREEDSTRDNGKYGGDGVSKLRGRRSPAEEAPNGTTIAFLSDAQKVYKNRPEEWAKWEDERVAKTLTRDKTGTCPGSIDAPGTV
jgi:hypothetical protein